MKRPLRYRGWLIGIGLMGGLVGGVLWGMQNLRTPVLTFPDGSRMILLSRTYGHGHSLAQRKAPWWQPWKPSEVVAWEETAEPSLGLWFTSPFPLFDGTKLPAERVKVLWEWAEIQDETGSRSLNADYAPALLRPSFARWWNFEHPIFGTEIGEGCFTNYTDPFCFRTCQHFPRRGNRLTIRLYRSDKKVPVNTLTLPNPTRGSFPEWKPEPLPAQRQSGDLTLQLQAASLEERAVWKQGDELSVVLFDESKIWQEPHHLLTKAPLVRCRLNLHENGGPLTHWEVVRMVFTDPTGNALYPAAQGQALATDARHYDLLFPGWCSGERVGRLRVEMLRDTTTDFPASEQIVLPPMTVPTPSRQSPPIAVTLNGIPATISLVGSGATQLSKYCNINLPEPYVAIRFAHRINKMCPFVDVRDPQGRTFYPPPAVRTPAYYRNHPLMANIPNMGLGTGYTWPTTPQEWQRSALGPFWEESPITAQIAQPNRPYNPTPLSTWNKPQWMVYPIGQAKPGQQVQVRLVANPVQVFEFTVALPTLASSH